MSHIKKIHLDKEPKRDQNILKAPVRVIFTPIRDMEVFDRKDLITQLR